MPKLFFFSFIQASGNEKQWKKMSTLNMIQRGNRRKLPQRSRPSRLFHTQASAIRLAGIQYCNENCTGPGPISSAVTDPMRSKLLCNASKWNSFFVVLHCTDSYSEDIYSSMWAKLPLWHLHSRTDWSFQRLGPSQLAVEHKIDNIMY